MVVHWEEQGLSWVIWLLVVPVSALVTGGCLRAAGVPHLTAVWAGIAAGSATAITLGAIALTVLVECVAENADPPPPPSWSWSPRRQFCNDRSSAAGLGALALLVVPTALVVAGSLLRFKRHTALGWTAYGLMLFTPVVPAVYVNALPYYRLDSYPVLHQPLLRPASGSKPPRVCYLYGIAFGPRKVEVTSTTSRECVEFTPTPEARSLTARYDEGRTIYDLDWVGRNLRQTGLPVRPGATGVDGLLVGRAYKLPDSQARVGATLVN